eukprot:TRINITY_DN9048_c0_g1_i3.p1 TRINITY_DN9048_c0_g1~~TRINITY_DN9048_c0_g1_i3.p1  ORF type:complete len:945 (+),score=336.51 TRINITY_DN9048_c0_g1_i3:52-2886(+)
MRSVGFVWLALLWPAAAQQECMTFSLSSPDDYRVCWETPVADVLTLHLTVKTSGWVGLGIAEQLSSWMPGSDIVTVEWDAQGQPVLTDRYATGEVAPPADPCGPEEWSMDGFQRSNGVVTGTLRRKVVITDTQVDRSILPGKQRVILAYGSNTQPTMVYHGTTRKSVGIEFVPGLVAQDPTHDKTLVIMPGGFMVPPLKTMYTYVGVDVLAVHPEMRTQKHQLIGFEFIGNDSGKPYDVHHVVVEVCASPKSFVANKVVASADVFECQMKQQLHLWAPGVDTYYLPPEAGFPVSETENRYIFLDFHYDNPTLAAGHMDNSGMRLLFTSTPRKHDAAMLSYGDYLVVNEPNIPADNQPHLFQFNCPAECMEGRVFGDLTIIGTFLHMHELGRKIRSNVWKNGTFVREHARIDYWNFGYQGTAPTQPGDVLHPGEYLHLTCEQVNNRGTVQKYGLGSEDEMCLAALVVYPKANLGVDVCGSQYERRGELVAVCDTPDTSEWHYVKLPDDYPDIKNITDGPIEPLFGVPDPGCTAAPVPTPIGTRGQCTPSTLRMSGSEGTFDCMSVLDGTVSLHWTLGGGVRSFALQSTAAGYIAIGFPDTPGTMGPGAALIATVDGAHKYKLGDSKLVSNVVKSVNVLPGVTGVVTATVNGATVLYWAESTAAAGSGRAGSVLGSSDVLKFNYAYHTSQKTLGVHSVRKSVELSLVSAVVTDTTRASDQDKVKTHAGLMVVVWGFLVPFGILLKRHLPLVTDAEVAGLPLPFVLHAAVMCVAIVLTVAMVALALDQFTNDTTKSHREVGIAALSGCVLQIVMQVAKPAADSPRRIFFTVAHVLVGAATLLLCTVQLFTGAHNYERIYQDKAFADDMRITVLVGLCVFAVAFVALQVVQIVRPRTSANLKQTSPDSEDRVSSPTPRDPTPMLPRPDSRVMPLNTSPDAPQAPSHLL